MKIIIDGKEVEVGSGADGFSPTVEVTDIDGGHQVTITDANGTQSFDVMDGQDAAGGSGVPSGFIGMWSGATAPDGWTLCDGTNGTPDLRGRFVLGSSSSHAMGSTGGSEEVTLTMEQMPNHNHAIYAGTSTGTGASGPYWRSSNASYSNGKTDYAGGLSDTPIGSSQPHPNMPPYYVLAYIMKL